MAPVWTDREGSLSFLCFPFLPLLCWFGVLVGLVSWVLRFFGVAGVFLGFLVVFFVVVFFLIGFGGLF